MRWPAAAVFVWVVWLAAFASTLLFVATFGSPYVPPGDDVEGLLPGIAQPLPEAWSWLWTPHSEHRVVLPKLVLWINLYVLGLSLRSVMLLGVIALGMVALVMILTAGKIRGRIWWSDAFFPLVFLSWSQVYNLLISWQFQFVFSTALAGLLLCVVAGPARPLRLGQAIVAGTCLVLLTLSGANGAAMCPALIVWAGFSAIRSWRSSPDRPWSAGVLAAAALASLGLVTFLVLTLPKPTFTIPLIDPGFKDYIRTSLEFFSTGLGPTFIDRWGIYGGAAVAAIIFFGAAALAIAAFTRRCKLFHVVNLALFLSGWLCVCLALVWGRAPFGETGGNPSRYYTLVVPGWCGIYWAWMIFRGHTGRLMQLLLLVLATTTFLANIRSALSFGGMFRYATSTIEQTAASGRPLPVVAQMYCNFFGHHNPQRFNEVTLPCFQALQQVGFAPYQFAPPEPPLTHQLFPLDSPPYGAREATWESGTLRILGDRPMVVLALPKPRLVHAIRFTYQYDLAAAEARFQVYWRLSDADAFDDMRSMTFYLPVRHEEQTVTIVVSEEIGQFRVHPADIPGVLHISKIELLLPATATQ